MGLFKRKIINVIFCDCYLCSYVRKLLLYPFQRESTNVMFSDWCWYFLVNKALVGSNLSGREYECHAQWIDLSLFH